MRGHAWGAGSRACWALGPGTIVFHECYPHLPIAARMRFAQHRGEGSEVEIELGVLSGALQHRSCRYVEIKMHLSGPGPQGADTRAQGPKWQT